MKQQKGFTLVEIAIVLVIIGLLLGGVLKGQEMIENSKVKAVVNDLRGVQSAMNSYRDRYRNLPGDETINTTNVYGWAANVGGGNGNGLVGAASANPFTAGGENTNFWRALRYASLITGDPSIAGAAASRPTSGAGGTIGVSNTLFGIGGNVVCTQNLSAKLAGAIDRLIDDGANATGSVRAAGGAASPVPAAAAPAAAAYNETSTNLYTLCMQM